MNEADKKEEENDRKIKKDDEDIEDEKEATISKDKEEDGSRPVRTRGEKMLAENDEIDEKQTMKFLKKLEREERKRKHEGDQDEGRIGQVMEHNGNRRVNGYIVNEEVMEVEEEEEELLEDDEELDPQGVIDGRREELEFMVDRLDMFEFGTIEEAWKRGGKKPTTTKWVEGWKKMKMGRSS